MTFAEGGIGVISLTRAATNKSRSCKKASSSTMSPSSSLKESLRASRQLPSKKEQAATHTIPKGHELNDPISLQVSASEINYPGSVAAAATSRRRSVTYSIYSPEESCETFGGRSIRHFRHVASWHHGLRRETPALRSPTDGARPFLSLMMICKYQEIDVSMSIGLSVIATERANAALDLTESDRSVALRPNWNTDGFVVLHCAALAEHWVRNRCS
jgi:hypothetical protein